MTTYELPPEPPIGSRVKDAEGNIWERTSDKRRWTRTNDEYAHSWSAMLTVVAPLTLIEPDPWPTEPLIVATIGDTGLRELFTRSDDSIAYENATSYVQPDAQVPLTNVVPVTVVPTAEWEALVTKWDEKKHLGYGENTVAEAIAHLIAATDALGLD